MNKALHAFVYLFLILTGAALYFEFQLNEKRTEMKDRNRMQEDFIMEVARLTETGEETEKADAPKIPLDTMPVTADEADKEVDEDHQEDMLDVKGYDFSLEKTDNKYFTWGENERARLRQVYVLDSDGKPEMDGSEKMTRGSEEDVLLGVLKKGLENQKERLSKTREAVTALREQLAKAVEELNALKPVARKDKASIIERDDQIAKLEEERDRLESEKKKLNVQIDELNTDLTAARQDVLDAKQETDAVKEDLQKERELTTSLKKLVADLKVNTSGGAGTEADKVVTSVPVGDKGTVLVADNENMFAIVKFTPEAMKELKGPDLSKPLPLMTFSVRRPGFEGPAGEIVGSLRIRQEVPGRSYLVGDILGDWAQAEIQPGDIVFAN